MNVRCLYENDDFEMDEIIIKAKLQHILGKIINQVHEDDKVKFARMKFYNASKNWETKSIMTRNTVIHELWKS